jgi:hypothetical protein
MMAQLNVHPRGMIVSWATKCKAAVITAVVLAYQKFQTGFRGVI